MIPKIFYICEGAVAMAKTEPINQELEFNVGEEETEATVEMNEDGSEAQVAAEDPPVV